MKQAGKKQYDIALKPGANPGTISRERDAQDTKTSADALNALVAWLDEVNGSAQTNNL